MNQNPRFILTGGPGMGKTSALRVLGSRNFVCVPEVARMIIRERLGRGLSPRPDPASFAAEILAADKAQYDGIAAGADPIFFDRGLPDALGMVHECYALESVALLSELSHRPYNRNVFCFQPWQEIYAQDGERDQSWEDALVIAESVRNWYRSLGFSLIDVPKADIELRADFIVDTALRILGE